MTQAKNNVRSASAYNAVLKSFTEAMARVATHKLTPYIAMQKRTKELETKEYNGSTMTL